MYIEIIRRVLEEAICLYGESSQKSKNEILTEVNAHIVATSSEHRQAEPQIQYEEPLCRLGYLYSCMAQRMPLFLKKQYRIPTVLRLKIENASQGVLKICSMGGGPGTELMGLAKYLRKPSRILTPPRKISFTVSRQCLCMGGYLDTTR